VYEAHIAMQESILNWGKLLIASGGSLKPAKCFYNLISFKWKKDGSWDYKHHEDNEELIWLCPWLMA